MSKVFGACFKGVERIQMPVNPINLRDVCKTKTQGGRRVSFENNEMLNLEKLFFWHFNLSKDRII